MPDAKPCVQCGAQINALSRFCVYCGTDQDDPAAPRAARSERTQRSDAGRGQRETSSATEDTSSRSSERRSHSEADADEWFGDQGDWLTPNRDEPAPDTRRARSAGSADDREAKSSGRHSFSIDAMATRVSDGFGDMSRPRVIALAALALAIVITIVVIAAPGGSKKSPTPPATVTPSVSTGSNGGVPTYVTFRGHTLTTLVPQGWHQTSIGPGTVSYSDPDEAHASFLIVTTRPAGGSNRSRARAAAEANSAPAGSTAVVQFPGGRHVYRVAFASKGIAHAIYVFSACKPSVGVSVSLTAPGTTDQLFSGPLDAIPPSALPYC